MNEFILKSEPGDRLLNKQTAKIGFLQKEVHQMQDYVKDLEEIVKINKEALKLVLNPNNNENEQLKNQNTSQSSILSHYPKDGQSFSQSHQLLPSNDKKILGQLCDENKKLFTILEKIKSERNFAQTKV